MNDVYYIKINGKANISEPLEIDHNYKITADCSITEDRKVSNEDGTYSITFKAEPMTVEIEKDNGEIIKANDPRKNSTKFRNFLFKVYTELGVIHDFDSTYDEVIWVAMSKMHSLVAEAVKRLDEKDAQKE